VAEQCNGLLFCDTEAVVTKLWSQIFLRAVPRIVEQLASEDRYKLYLVTRATEEWVQDEQRFMSEFARRCQFSDDCVAEMRRLGRNFVILDGTWKQRLGQAIRAVDALLTGGRVKDQRTE